MYNVLAVMNTDHIIECKTVPAKNKEKKCEVSSKDYSEVTACWKDLEKKEEVGVRRQESITNRPSSDRSGIIYNKHIYEKTLHCISLTLSSQLKWPNALMR